MKRKTVLVAIALLAATTVVTVEAMQESESNPRTNPVKMRIISGRIVDENGNGIGGVQVVYDGVYTTPGRRERRWSGTVLSK